MGQLQSQFSESNSQGKTGQRSPPTCCCLSTHTWILAGLPTCGPQQDKNFQFPFKTLIQSFEEDNKELVATDGEQVLCAPSQHETNLLAPYNHEEADSRMMLHVAYAARHGHQRILVRTVDTDVVVLAVMVAQKLSSQYEIWLAFGTGKNFQYLAAHEMASCLGLERSLALPMFHAMTGCDTVSSFVGHGKKTAWTIWKLLPELTGTLLKLADSPARVTEEAMKAIERFVILLYDKTSTCTDVNKARKKLLQRILLCKEYPYLCCTGTACKEGCLPGWSCLGTSTCPTATSSISK